MSTLLSQKVISAGEARKRLGELLDKAYYRRESFIVERAGQAKAAIVPMAQYNEMQRLREEARKRLFARIDQIQKKLAKRNPAEIERILEEAIEATRQR